MTDVDLAASASQSQMQVIEQEKVIRQQQAWIAALEEDNLRLSAQLKASQLREASVCKMYKGELLSKGSLVGELANAKGMVTEIWNWAIRSGPALSQRQLLTLLKAMELVLSGNGGKVVSDAFTRDMLICQALAHVIAAKQLQREADGNPPDDEDTEPIAPIPTEPDETPPVVAIPASEEGAEKVGGEESPAIVEAMGKQVVIIHKEGPAFDQQQGALSKAEGQEERQKPAFMKAPPRIKVPRWPANTATPEEQSVYARQFGQAGRIVSGQVPRDFREGQTIVLESREDAAEAEFNLIITDSNRRIAAALSGRKLEEIEQ